uniref:Uncharacterized protein n=1 Tax=Knipowitschia caucasica TaxID=637954 RepID=A0AAV2KKE5_KNICA
MCSWCDQGTRGDCTSWNAAPSEEEAPVSRVSLGSANPLDKTRLILRALYKCPTYDWREGQKQETELLPNLSMEMWARAKIFKRRIEKGGNTSKGI